MPASVLPSPIGASISTTEMRSSVSPNRTSMSSCNPRRPPRGMLGQTSVKSRPKSTSGLHSPLSSRNRSTFCSASAQVFSGSNHVSASAKRSPDAIQSDKIVRPSSKAPAGPFQGFSIGGKNTTSVFKKRCRMVSSSSACSPFQNELFFVCLLPPSPSFPWWCAPNTPA